MVHYESICHSCEYELKYKAEDEMILSMGLLGDSVQECLWKEMDWELICDYKCDECNVIGKTRRQGFFDVDMGDETSHLLVLSMKIFNTGCKKFIIN